MMKYSHLLSEFSLRTLEKISRRISDILLIAGLIIIISSPAYANVGLGYILMVAATPAAPLYLALHSYGLALLGIILIEVILLRIGLKCSWFFASIYSLFVNIISTIVGILIGATATLGDMIYMIVILLIPAIGIFLIIKLKAPKWFYLSIIFLLAFVVLFIVFSFLMHDYLDELFNFIREIIVIEILLLYGLGVTLIIEGLLLFTVTKNTNTWKAILYANIGSYIILFIMWPFIIPYGY